MRKNELQSHMSLLREAHESDLNDIVDIINEAKLFLKNNDIPQWQNEYPNINDIEKDLKKGYTFVQVSNNKTITGTVTLWETKDSNYEKINGSWLPKSNEKYATIHRTVIKGDHRGQGLGNEMIKSLLKIAHDKGFIDIRLDTHESNLRMRRLSEKLGFSRRGTIFNNLDHSMRTVYQIILHE